jgi:TrmH family RNA methyltransferase
LLSATQSERIEVVLVSPRNPLNIGAAARAMANFGFSRLTVTAPYEPHWREAQSAVGAEDLLKNAKVFSTLREAVTGCTLVVGTGTLTQRKPEQPVVRLPEIFPHIFPLLPETHEANGRVAVVFGPEKHGLTRDDLSYCNLLVEIPTDQRQPSMNLGQAVAVCLYELAVRFSMPVQGPTGSELQQANATSGDLDLLAEVIDRVSVTADYSPSDMREANRHDLRLLLRRLALTEPDARRTLRFFRRVLWRLEHQKAPHKPNRRTGKC